MQLIFPLLFVEQQTGWAGVRDNVPTYLRVPRAGAPLHSISPEPASGADRAGQREEFDSQISKVRSKWAEAIGELRGALRGEFGDRLRRARRASGIGDPSLDRPS